MNYKLIYLLVLCNSVFCCRSTYLNTNYYSYKDSDYTFDKSIVANISTREHEYIKSNVEIKKLNLQHISYEQNNYAGEFKISEFSVKKEQVDSSKLADYLSLNKVAYSVDTFYRRIYLINKITETSDTINIINEKLFEIILEWLGNKYKYAGNSKKGIDCSALMVKFAKYAYDIDIFRSSLQQCKSSQKLDEKEIQEGDLVFFKIKKKRISHVGMYLGNRYFIHSSVSSGVTFSSIDEPYWHSKIAMYGRVVDASVPHRFTQKILSKNEQRGRFK